MREALGEGDALELLGLVVVKVVAGRGGELGLERRQLLLGGGSELRDRSFVQFGSKNFSKANRRTGSAGAGRTERC